jgi:hypothetical protein
VGLGVPWRAVTIASLRDAPRDGASQRWRVVHGPETELLEVSDMTGPVSETSDRVDVLSLESLEPKFREGAGSGACGAFLLDGAWQKGFVIHDQRQCGQSGEGMEMRSLDKPKCASLWQVDLSCVSETSRVSPFVEQ